MTQKNVSVRLAAVGGRQVAAEFQGVGKAGTQSLGTIERQANVTGAALRRLSGIVAASFSVRQIVAYADTWSDLSSRVSLAAGSQEAGAAVMERLQEVARRTYSSLEQTAEGWAQNAAVLRELGMSLGETLDFQEALNNALVVSGAKADRAASVQRALAQAMALGALRGDQLNTVIQNGGRVAELLAADLGVGINQLRALGQQGVITGDVIERALVGNLQLLREEAEAMPATIGDAFTLIGNAALTLVGTWDQMVGGTETLAGVLIRLADNIEVLAAGAIGLAIVMTGRWAVSLGVLRGVMVAVNATMGVTGIMLTGGSLARGLLMARLATMAWTGSLVALKAALLVTGIGALIVGAGTLVYWFGRLVKGAGGFGEALSLLGELAAGVWDGMVASAKSVVPGLNAVWKDVQAGFLAMVSGIMTRWQEMLIDLAGGLRGAPGTDAVVGSLIDRAAATSARIGSVDRLAQGFKDAAESERALSDSIVSEGWSRASDAATALRDAITGAGDDGEDALNRTSGAADRLADTVTKAGGAGRAAGREIADGIKDAETAADRMRGSFESAFVGFVTGTKKARDALAALASDLAQMLARRGFGMLWDSIFGGPTLVSGPSVASVRPMARPFEGGGFTGHGPRSGGLDGRGGFLAMLHPNETVIDHTRGQSQAVTVHIIARTDPGVMLEVAEGAAARVTQQALGAYDRQVLPARVAQIGRQPYRRG